ncbi:hypothetical protein B0H11DRAFT_1928103 [Mycena galericulata]|nr:hypothetical protein B0H11DRAFT_1928103 [Mycena galericulata]
MAPPSFAFARYHLIFIAFLTLQFFVSGTQAFHCSDDVDFDCNDKNEDPATQQKNRIIAASVAGVCLLLIAVAYFIYAYRKRRIRARPVHVYPFAGQPAAFPPSLGPPPPSHPGYGYAPGYNSQTPDAGGTWMSRSLYEKSGSGTHPLPLTVGQSHYQELIRVGLVINSGTRQCIAATPSFY